MSTLRTTAAVLGILLLVACGGGGGGTPPDPGDPGGGGEPPPAEVQAVTQSVLETCLLAGLEDAVALLDRLDALLAGSGAGVGFSLVPGSVTADEFMLEMLVALDVDGNQTEDGVGRLQFLSDAGLPVNPFDAAGVSLLSNQGVSALGTLLPTLPDGHQVSFEIQGPGLDAGGTVTWTFQSGSPVGSEGVLTAGAEPCAVSVGFVDQVWADLLTSFPTATLAVTVTRALPDDVDSLEGSLVADGTATALVDVALNGGDVTEWTFNLLTGEAALR